MATLETELEGTQNGSLWLQAPRSCFDVGVVPAGGVHVLRRFCIRNLAQENATLHLQSQRPRLVSFQRENPNLELDVPNEAFNTIDLFSSLHLKAGESREIVLRVLPVLPSRKTGHAAANERFNFADVRVGVEARLEVGTGTDCIDFDVVMRVCRSQLSVDTTELSFDNCTLGRTWVKELTVWNRSEIDTCFSLVFGGCNNIEKSCFTFVDYDSAHPLLPDQPIRGFSHIRIRVNFEPRPELVGDFSHEIVLENVSDLRNSLTLRIHTSVAEATRAEDIRISPSTLDFGDCCRGINYSRLLLLKNVTQHPLDVLLSSDLTEGTVWFHLHTDLEPDADAVVDDDDHEDEEDEKDEGVIHKDIDVKVSEAEDVFRGEESPAPEQEVVESSSSSMLVSLGATEATGLAPSESPILSSSGGNGTSASPLPMLSSSRDRIEELMLAPGKERNVLVCFCPGLDRDNGQNCGQDAAHSSTARTPNQQSKHEHLASQEDSVSSLSSMLTEDENCEEAEDEDGEEAGDGLGAVAPTPLGRLQLQRFRLLLKCKSVSVGDGKRKSKSKSKSKHNDRYSRTVACSSRVCTSLITVSPPVLNLGKCAVGSQNTATFRLLNLSDVPTTVELLLSSSCLTIPRGPVSLAARSLCDVRIEHAPHRSCLDYSKKIRIVNVQNPGNEQSLLVRASSVDQFGPEFHSLFYELELIDNTRKGVIDFGSFVSSYPAMRSIIFTNLTNNDLRLELGSSASAELGFFASAVPLQEDAAAAANTSVDADAGGDAEVVSAEPEEHRPLLPPEPTLSRSDSAHALGTGGSGSRESAVPELMALLAEKQPPMPPWFPSTDAECEYVQTELRRMMAWKRLVESGGLAPVRDLYLRPHKRRSLLLVFCVNPTLRGKLSSKLRNIAASVSVRLVEGYIESIANWTIEDVPYRTLQVQAKVCRASMAFAQRHINFGLLNNLHGRCGTFVMSNNCDVALQYKVQKTGSIASDDVVLTNGDAGVLRPYQQREVPFEFRPSLAGRYLQTLTFVNVQDENDRHLVVVKADIRKPFNFWLQSVELDFGYCLFGHRSRTRRLILKNISERARTFKIKADGISPSSSSSSSLSVLFEAGELSLGPAVDAGARDEEREKLESKLKICVRKNKLEKAAKIRKRLAELKHLLMQDEANDNDLDSDETYANLRGSEMPKNGGEPQEVVADKRGDAGQNTLLVMLPPSAVQKILVKIVPRSRRSAGASVRIEALKGAIRVYEHNNKEYVRSVSYYVRICKDEDIYRQALERRLKSDSNFRSLYSSSLLAQAPAVAALRSSSPVRTAFRSASSSPIAFSRSRTVVEGSLALRVPRHFLFGAMGSDRRSSRSVASEAQLVSSRAFRVPSSLAAWDPLPHIFVVASGEGAKAVVRWKPGDPAFEGSLQFQVRVCDQPSFANRVRRRLRHSEIVATNRVVSDEFSVDVSELSTNVAVEDSVGDEVEFSLKGGEKATVFVRWVGVSSASVEWPVPGQIELTCSSDPRPRLLSVRVCSPTSPLELRPPLLLIPPGKSSRQFSIYNPTSVYTRISVESPSIHIELGESRSNSLFFDVAPESSVSLLVTINDAARGAQPASILLWDTTHCHKLRLSVLGVLRAKLSPLSLEPASALELGTVFCGKYELFERLIPIRLRSAVRSELRVTAVSNLRSQVQLFRSEACVHELNDSVMPAGGSLEVYVRVRVPLDPLASASGTCRELLAGVTVCAAANEIALPPLHVPLSCTIGAAVAQVYVEDAHGASIVDFGVLGNSSLTLSFVIVRNLSLALPLRFSVSVPETVSVSKADADADTEAVAACALTGSLAAGACTRLRLEVRPQRSGWFQHQVLLSLPDAPTPQLAPLTLQGFVDPELVQIDLPLLDRLPHLQLGNLYVQRNDAGGFELEVSNAPGCIPLRSRSSTALRLHALLSSGLIGELSWGSKSLLQPGGSSSLQLRLEPSGPGLDDLSSGASLPFSGFLYITQQVCKHGPVQDDFGEHDHANTVAVVRLLGAWVVSQAVLGSTTIDVGRVGHDQDWQDVALGVELRNESDIALEYSLELPEAVSAVSTTSILEARGQRRLQLCLHPKLLNPGLFLLHVRLHNLHNRDNDLHLELLGEVQDRVLEFSRLSGDGALLMPSISLPKASSEERFSVRNTSAGVIALSASVDVPASLRDSLVVHLKPVYEFELAPAERVELRLHASVVPAAVARLAGSKSVGSRLVIAELKFTVVGSQRTEIVPVLAQLKLGASFALSRAKIALNGSARTQEFSLRNQSEDSELRFHIRMLGEAAARLSVDPIEGVLEASKSTRVLVRLLHAPNSNQEQEHDIEGKDAVCQIEVSDRDAKQLVRTIEVKIAPSNTHHRLVTQQEHAVVGASCLGVRGATALEGLEGRYEIAPGQQSLERSRQGLQWELELENLGDAPLEFFVRRAGPDLHLRQQQHIHHHRQQQQQPQQHHQQQQQQQPQHHQHHQQQQQQQQQSTNANEANSPVRTSSEHGDWLSISCSGGVLESCHDTAMVTVTMWSDTPGTFSCYFVIGTLASAADLKTFRVELEVVEAFDESNTSVRPRFEVITNGRCCKKGLRAPLIDLGDVFYSHFYRNRSFIISNLSTVPLEFVLSTGQNAQCRSSLYFSLSTTTLKLFTSLTVVAGGSAVVYIHFQPAIEDESLPDEPLQLSFPIHVNCRLVKDYQVAMEFRARCLSPQMRLSTRDIVFVGGSCSSSQDGEMQVLPAEIDLFISNNFSTPLLYNVRNDSRYFDVDTDDPSVIEPPHKRHRVRIRPRLSVLMQKRDFLSAEQYIEEHLTVYNMSQLSERLLVSLRFTRTALPQPQLLFYLAPGPKKGFTFSTIEQNIVAFIRNFELYFEGSAFLRLMLASDASAIEGLSQKLQDLMDSPRYRELYFHFFYITDELVFYGLKGHVGHFVFQLADLLYCFVLQHRVFNCAMEIGSRKNPPSAGVFKHFLTQWFQHINYFLSHFPTLSGETPIYLRKRLQELSIRDCIYVARK